jgi:SAM-dependent methyltransferase
MAKAAAWIVMLCLGGLLAGCGSAGNQPQATQHLLPVAAAVQPEVHGDVEYALAFGMKNGNSAVVGCSERIVEVPFVHRNLPYPFRGRLLDVGYRESEIIFQTASLGFDAWGIDIRPPAAEFPGAHFVQGDVIKNPFEPKSFDVVIGLSTFEHIGLTAYGNTAKDPDGDLHAVQAVHRILKPSGRFLLTVPFGKHGATDWYRVYDHAALTALLKGSGLRIELENYWTKKGDAQWVPTLWKEAEQVDSVSSVKGVACVVARPI